MTSTVLAYIPSPSQGVWHLGPFPLRAYALFIIIGIVAALVLGDRRWVARGGEPGVIYDIALWAVPFGLIGGRLYHVITDWRTYFGDDGAGFGAALRIWDGGLGIWGAVALGAVGAWIACKRRDIPLPAFGDAIAPGIILAQAIGRLGNYFNQELYGRETTVPWGLEIYERVNSAGVPDSLNGVSTGELVQVVHPTFLYELIWNLLVFAALILVDRRFRIGHGRLFAMYVAGYCVGRFWIELMRSDTATHLAGIRVNSFTSTFVFIGAVVYIMVAPKGREDPLLLRGNTGDGESRAEELVKDLALGASTTGVVAAATVAAQDDERSVADRAESDDLVADDFAPDREADLETVAGSDGAPEAGLGSVEGDEVGEAVEGASEAHAVAVEGEDAAGALVDDVESDSVESQDAVVVSADGAASDADAVEPEAGLGSVDGDELIEAVDSASEAHAVAVEGEDAANALTDDAESDASAAEPEAGLGSVDGDELIEAVEDAPEAHAVAVEGEDAAEALVDGVESESDAGQDAVVVSADDPYDVGSEAGLDSVDGDEVAEAVEGAPVAHAVAVEGEDAAGALVDDVESDASAAEPEAGLGSVEGDEVGEAVEGAPEAHAVAVEGEDAANALTDDAESDASDAKPEAGLGSVESDEVAEAVEGAPEAHAVAVEGEDAAEALVDDAESDSTSDAGRDAVVVSADDASAAEPEAGLGSIEGDEVAEAVEDASEAHTVAVEGNYTAEALTGDGASDASDDSQTPAPVPPPSSGAASAYETRSPASIPAEVGQRVRQWIRRRRSR